MSFKGDLYETSWTRCHGLVISAFGRLTQKEFETNLGYKNLAQRHQNRAWEDGLAVRNIGCSRKDPEFES